MNPTREEALFAAALERPAAERAAFLDGACLGDQPLRQRVEALLASHDATANPLATRAGPARTIQIEFPDEPADDAVGQTLGRYKLLEKIGEGGCGVVYVADQTEPVRRRVALKVIKLGMDTKQVVARFEAERQALAMMDHPNIAKVLDAGTTENGRPYFVMELVRGIRITDYCDQAQLNTGQRLDLFITVCQAIQHAHQKGIIHRDIKPSNILVTLHDGVPVPKVIDFGIAKATEGRLTDATVYTQLHQFMGTPAYMSPEQAEMSGLDIDTRSDIYSLGVLLYELLAGSTPFDPRDLMAAGIDAMRRTIREQEPPRPSTRLATLPADHLTTTAKSRSVDTTKLLHQLKGDLDWIVMKCLEKDRTRRYETASSLAADLRRHVENEPVLARPPSLTYRLGKAIRKNRLAFAAAATVFAALSTAVVVSTVQTTRARAEKKLAEDARRDAEATTSLLIGLFSSPSPGQDGRSVTVVDSLDRARVKIDSDPAMTVLVRARLHSALAKTYASLGLYEPALKLHHTVVDNIQRAFGTESPEAWEVRMTLAFCEAKAGNRDDAIRRGQAVVKEARAKLPKSDPRLLGPMTLLGGLLADQKRSSEVIPLREEVLALNQRHHGNHSHHTIAAMMNLSNSYEEAGRAAEALKMREDVLQLSRTHLGPDHQTTLMAMNNVASTYEAMGRRDEALSLIMGVVEGYRRVHGPDHGYTLGAINSLALLHSQRGNSEEALRLMLSIVEPARKQYGPQHPEMVEMWDMLRDLCLKTGRSQEAVRYGEDALNVSRQSLGAEHVSTLACLNNLGATCRELGMWKEAIRWFEECLPLSAKVLGYDHPSTALLQHNLSSTLSMCPLASERNPARALELSSAATRIMTNDPAALRGLGFALSRGGDHAAAIQSLAKSLEVPGQPLAATAFFLAQSRWHAGQREQARADFKRGDEWFQKNDAKSKQLAALKAETEALLGSTPAAPQ